MKSRGSEGRLSTISEVRLCNGNKNVSVNRKRQLNFAW